MTYIEEQAAQAAQMEANRFEANNQVGLRMVFATYPQIPPSMANIQMLEAYCQLGFVTLEAVQFALENGSPLIEKLALQDEVDIRKRFVDKIVSLTKGDADTKAHLRGQLLSKFGEGFDVHTTEELQHKANETEKRVNLSGKSAQELRTAIQTSTDPNIVGDALAAENTMKQSSKLIEGRMYELIPAEITAKAIRLMKSPELRRLISRFHYTQVNERLNVSQGRN